MKFNDSVIMTILGIGYINGGMILGETGDIQRFFNLNKLFVFAGLYPICISVWQLPSQTDKNAKRGSRILRYTFVNATHNVVKNNATFKAYYDKKWQKFDHTIIL